MLPGPAGALSVVVRARARRLHVLLYRVAEIDLDEIVKARYDFDPVGHYARPDVFRLTVDENTPKSSTAPDPLP